MKEENINIKEEIKNYCKKRIIPIIKIWVLYIIINAVYVYIKEKHEEFIFSLFITMWVMIIDLWIIFYREKIE